MRGQSIVASALAAGSAVLGALTLAWPAWLEGVVGWDPDRHSGAVEWLVAVVLISAAIALSRAAYVVRHSAG